MNNTRKKTVSGTAGSSCRGFTLPEVLIAVVILATGIVAVLRAFSVSLAVLSESRNILKANVLIMEKMAEMEISAIKLGDVDTGVTSGLFDKEDSNYHWEFKVDKVQGGFGAAADSATLNQVDLTVWRDGSERHYKASTYLKTGKKQ